MDSPPATRPMVTAGPDLRDMAELAECSTDCMVQIDSLGRLTYANAAARAELARAGRRAEGLHWRALLGAHAQAGRLRRMAAALRRHGRWEGELWLQGQGSAAAPFHALVVAHCDDSGQPCRHSAMLRNVSAERDARQHIQRQADILRAIAEAIPATVVVVDAEGRYRYANPAFERYSGLPASRIVGRHVTEVLGAQEVARRAPYMAHAYAGQAVEFTLDYPDAGGTRWLALTCIPLKVDGLVDGFVGIGQDVTQHHVERHHLRHLAETDRLTGLLNRAGFEHAIEALMRRDATEGVALLYIDLDAFKPVNDRHGHPVGDRLLQLFALRLRAATRAGDKVARLGGDEFAVLLNGVRDEADALLVANKVLAAAHQPFEVDGHRLAVSASIGVACGLRPQAGWRELVARADASLYRAKALGRARAVA